MANEDLLLAFDNKIFDVNILKASDDVSLFLSFVEAIEHYALHAAPGSESTASELIKIVQKITNKTISIGVKIFTNTCSYSISKTTPKFNKLHYFNVNMYNNLVNALQTSASDNNRRTQILYDSGLIGRERWPMLALYLICYRLDILFTLPFICNNRSENIAHSVISLIFSKYRIFNIDKIMLRETSICSKYGYNNTYLAIMCAKLFGTFPAMTHVKLHRFLVKCSDDSYWIIPSLSLKSIEELLYTFDKIAIAADGSELLSCNMPVTANGTFMTYLKNGLVIKNTSYLQMCSREFIYYLATNNIIYNDYKNDQTSNAALFRLQSMAIAFTNSLKRPVKNYIYDSQCDQLKPQTLNRRGESVISYYDAENTKRNHDVNLMASIRGGYTNTTQHDYESIKKYSNPWQMNKSFIYWDNDSAPQSTIKDCKNHNNSFDSTMHFKQSSNEKQQFANYINGQPQSSHTPLVPNHYYDNGLPNELKCVEKNSINQCNTNVEKKLQPIGHELKAMIKNTASKAVIDGIKQNIQEYYQPSLLPTKKRNDLEVREEIIDKLKTTMVTLNKLYLT